MPIAPGIQQRIYGNPTDLSVGDLVKFYVQEHLAERAKLHTDVRLGNKKRKLYSWAVRKGLPEPGQKHFGAQTFLHDEGYGPFSGIIKSRYGRGLVTSKIQGKALITNVDDKGITFATATEGTPQRFRLQRLKGERDWLLINVTPTKSDKYKKINYRHVPAEDVEQLFTPENMIQAKADGSASWYELLKDKIEVLSYRTHKDTGYPIVHTERAGLYGLKNLDLPKNTTLRGEIYAEGPKGPLTAAETGGILNSTLENSINKQKDKDIRLRHMLFDIVKYKGKDLKDMPYRERYKLLQSIAAKLPKDFYVAEGTTDPEKQRQMWKDIIKGTHPLTREGIVAHPLSGGVPSKVKQLEESDVIITGVFKGKGKYQNSAGGFTYALPSNPTKTVGEVGTGLRDEDRKDMWDNQKDWVGRTARIRAQEQFSSGAYRAPSFSFLARHEDIQQKTAIWHPLPDKKQTLSFLKKAGMYKQALSANTVIRAVRRAAKANGNYANDRLLKTLSHVMRWSKARAARIEPKALAESLKPSIKTTPTEGGTLRVPFGEAKKYLQAWKDMKTGVRRPFVELKSAERFKPGWGPYAGAGFYRPTNIVSSPNWQALAHETGHALTNAKGQSPLGNSLWRMEEPTRRKVILDELLAWKNARQFLSKFPRWKTADPSFKKRLYDMQRLTLETHKNYKLNNLLIERFFQGNKLK